MRSARLYHTRSVPTVSYTYTRVRGAAGWLQDSAATEEETG